MCCESPVCYLNLESVINFTLGSEYISTHLYIKMCAHTSTYAQKLWAKGFTHKNIDYTDTNKHIDA